MAMAQAKRRRLPAADARLRILDAAEKRLIKHDDPTPPAIKECPACCETVPAKATRCKYCTSDLKAA